MQVLVRIECSTVLSLSCHRSNTIITLLSHPGHTNSLAILSNSWTDSLKNPTKNLAENPVESVYRTGPKCTNAKRVIAKKCILSACVPYMVGSHSIRKKSHMK